MNGQKVLTTNIGTSSEESAPHLWEYSIPELPCIRNENYGLRVHYQLDSVSWQTQHTIADRQLEQTFSKLAKKWKRDTMNLSSIGKMISHPAYLRIIGFGPKAIPLILNQMEKEPDFWFWALKSITGEDPITEEILGNLKAMTKAWLDWGREHGYY